MGSASSPPTSKPKGGQNAEDRVKCLSPGHLDAWGTELGGGSVISWLQNYFPSSRSVGAEIGRRVQAKPDRGFGAAPESAAVRPRAPAASSVGEGRVSASRDS